MARLNRTPPRFIKHESIRLLDTIRVTGRYLDTDTSKTGIVRKRLHEGRGVVYLTAQGAELLRVFGDGGTEPAVARITLVGRVVDSQPFDDDPEPTLFD